MNLTGLAVVVGCALAFSACGKADLRVPSVNTAPGSAGAANAGAEAGEGNPVDPPSPSPELGAACASDAECGANGLTCLGTDSDLALGLGAVPGGLCTHTCTSDAECQDFGSGAVCGNLAEVPLALDLGAGTTVRRYCMAGCSLGAPGGSSKCHAREEAACRPFAPPHAQRCATTKPQCPDGLSCFRGYCREFACGPRCNDDQECEAGRHCDPRSGLCTVGARPKTPIGTPCDPDAPSNPCEGGNCLVLFDENDVKTGSFCTQSCVIGAPCGNGRGACQLPRFGENFEVGDIGYCQPTCNCNAECQVAGDECVAWGDSKSEQLYSSKGVCQHSNGGPSLTECGPASAPN
ncbi:MAG: hypothetical protein ABJB12_16865 [Pseudomonadota bacterium]